MYTVLNSMMEKEVVYKYIMWRSCIFLALFNSKAVCFGNYPYLSSWEFFKAIPLAHITFYLTFYLFNLPRTGPLLVHSCSWRCSSHSLSWFGLLTLTEFLKSHILALLSSPSQNSLLLFLCLSYPLCYPLSRDPKKARWPSVGRRVSVRTLIL